MTEKQKLFCSYYIQTLNASESYRRAYPGASDRTCGENGFKLLKKTEIREFIDSHMQKKISDAIASEDEVLETITSILRDKKVKASDRLKASELLGKRYGSWVDRVEVKDNSNVTINIIEEIEEQDQEEED